MTSSGYGRRQVLSLYRSCRRSMFRIPDPAQRQMYETHLKSSFRAKRHLVPESREAIFAIDDAREQLDRMDYFHSIREEKERQQELSTRSNKEAVSSGLALSYRQEPALVKDDTGDVDDRKIEIVQSWLKEALPQLYADDLARYTSHLVMDGFDSTELLETELIKEDLNFMKKAHRRALIRIKGFESKE